MFDFNEFGAAGKRLNAEYLKGLPSMAVKVTITGGGKATFKDGTSQPFLTVKSSSFEGEKELLLNATNRNVLGAVFGKTPNAWIGKEIGVYFDPTVSMGGKAVGGLRVKPLMADPFASTPAPAAVAAAAPVEDSIPF